MIITHNFTSSNISLLIGNLGTDEAELINYLQPSIAAQAHLDILKAPSRRLEWLSARCLVKQLRPTDYDVVYNEDGKPDLASNLATISISHSSQMAGVLIDTQKRLIGIDLEKISERAIRIRHKFMAQNEDFFPANESALYCTLLWSAKEVMYKIMGTQYIDFKSSFRIMPFRFSEQGGMLQGIVNNQKRTEVLCLHYKQINDTILVWSAAN